MSKHHVAFVVGFVIGLTALIAVFTGGPVWPVSLLFAVSAIMTTTTSRDLHAEALRDGPQFVLSLFLAVSASAVAMFMADGSIFTATGRTHSWAEVPGGIRWLLAVAWCALAWHRWRGLVNFRTAV